MKFVCYIAIGCACSISHAADFDCMIEPAQTLELRSPVVGLIQQMNVRRGSYVNQNDVLVSIDSGVERSATDVAKFRSEALGALQVAESKLIAAREKAARTRQLHEEQFVSAQAREEAEAERKLAEAEVKSARESLELAKLEHRQSVEQLNRRVLRSPFSGVVMNVYLTTGALVDTSDNKKPILKLVQTDKLRVESFVPLKYYNQIRAGSAVTIRPEAPLKGELKAKVTTVDRVIDSASGTFGVVVELDNRKNLVPAGSRCKLGIDGL